MEASVVCDEIYEFAGARSEALAGSFAAAGARAATAIELTFAVKAAVKGGMDGEAGSVQLGIHLGIDNDPDYIETGLVAT